MRRNSDASTLRGRVLCGYQGWFTTPDDGANRGFYHYHSGPPPFGPGRCNIEMWPDVTELDADERAPTPFTYPDGRRAELYSAQNRKTVRRHFRWMRDYGIDGVFVQRFITEVMNPAGRHQFDKVLGNCRESALENDRVYAVMYDLSGLGANQMQRVKDDWAGLVDSGVTRDAPYLHHNDKPVVAVWGFGFADGRKYTLAEGIDLVRWLKTDPKYGGCTVMLGIPSYWRERKRDAVDDPALHTLAQQADIVSPWSVGRYRTLDAAARYAREVTAPDIAWCRAHGIEYMPVVYPGYSFSNATRGQKPFDEIPRQGGRFLWTQYANAVRAGATMVYQAMFDEMDEGTAIFKTTNAPPPPSGSPPTRFLTEPELPSDHYLRIVGAATRRVRGDLPMTDTLPGDL